MYENCTFKTQKAYRKCDSETQGGGGGRSRKTPALDRNFTALF